MTPKYKSIGSETSREEIEEPRKKEVLTERKKTENLNKSATPKNIESLVHQTVSNILNNYNLVKENGVFKEKQNTVSLTSRRNYQYQYS